MRRTGNVFARHKIWWTVLVAICIAFALIVRPETAGPRVSWAWTFGRVMGIFAASFVLAGIPYIVSLMERRRMTSTQFMATLTVAMVLVMGGNLVSVIQKKDEAQTEVKQTVTDWEHEQRTYLRGSSSASAC